MSQHLRLNNPYYSKPPTPSKPPFSIHRGSSGMWYVRMPDGSDRGPMCHRKVARKSIPLYRLAWEREQALKLVKKVKPRLARRKEAA